MAATGADRGKNSSFSFFINLETVFVPYTKYVFGREFSLFLLRVCFQQKTQLLVLITDPKPTNLANL